MNELPMLRSSERKDWKRCPTKWNWRYNESLVPLTFNAGPLWFGAGMHLAAAEHYVPGFKRGRDPRETWLEFVGETMDAVKTDKYVDDETVDSWEDAAELGVLMWDHYLKVYGNDDHIEVLMPEHIMKGIVVDPVTKKPMVRLVGVTDLVARNHAQNDRIELWDHKNMKTIQVAHLNIDDQNGGYLLLATKVLHDQGLIKPDEVVRGLLYNFLRKAKPDTREQNEKGQYLNKDGSVSARQGSPYFLRHWIGKTKKERNSQLIHISEEARVMKLQRMGKLPLWKTPDDSCRWQCNFFTMCEIDERNGDVEDYKKRMFKKADPYEDYRGDKMNYKASVLGYKERQDS